MNEKAKQQFKAPNEWFKENVKCCFNCDHWCGDISATEKAYAKKFGWNMCPHSDLLTAWDGCCDEYNGNAAEENLIVTLTKEERESLIAEMNEVHE